MHDIGLIPDLVFDIMFPDGSRRCFTVEIDRGDAGLSSDFRQTSVERKSSRISLRMQTSNMNSISAGRVFAYSP